MAYVANVTDKMQNLAEAHAFDGGIPTFEQGETRVITKANGAVEKDIAGVVVPPKDNTMNKYAVIPGKSTVQKA